MMMASHVGVQEMGSIGALVGMGISSWISSGLAMEHGAKGEYFFGHGSSRVNEAILRPEKRDMYV